MIKLAANSIMLIAPDGVISAFDPELLQARISNSLLTAGIQENWLAEDITLAVEFALAQSSREEKIFAQTEVNSNVTKILEDTGFPDAAKAFRKGNAHAGVALSAETQTVSELLAKHLGLDGDKLETVAAQVIAAAAQLRIRHAAPALYLEMAKYYETHGVQTAAMPFPKLNKWQQNSPCRIDAQSILEKLDAPALELVKANVIRLSGISRLFPAIKLQFMISGFAQHLNLAPPITEMFLQPQLFAAGEALNNCIQTAAALFAASGGEPELPLFLSVPDMSDFAVNMLQADWPAAEADCREMLEPLHAMISKPLFKLRLS